MDLWSQFIGSPEARAAAISAVLPFLMELIKPYLPTGEHTTPPGQAVENRYVPMASVIAGGILGILGALAVIFSSTFTGDAFPYAVQSLAYGLGAGFAASGFVRGYRLAVRGDVSARKSATYANELLANGIQPPPTPTP